MSPILAKKLDKTTPSRPMVLEAMSQLPRNFAKGRWVASNNKYAGKIKAQVKDDAKNKSSFRHQPLAQVVAAGVPLHVADSWSYLGAALTAHAQGRPDVSRHMAYYAELRAAMALLASHGVYVLDQKHIVLEDDGHGNPRAALVNGDGTHAFAWQALKTMARSPAVAETIYDAVRPDGIPLRRWLQAFGVETAAKTKAASWLRDWGLDLRQFKRDRDARNYSSYEPTKLKPAGVLNASDCADQLQKLWRTMEPDLHARFEGLDRFLLRHIFRWSYEKVLAKTGTPPPFEDLVEKVLVTDLGFVEPKAKLWKDFLVRNDGSDAPSIISLASVSKRKIGDKHHLQVICRATLLARLATGAAQLSLHDSNINRTDLEFWWRPWGESLGLWEPGSEPTDCSQLWADVEAGLDDVANWVRVSRASTPPSGSMKGFREKMPGPTHVLASCERVALWGLGL